MTDAPRHRCQRCDHGPSTHTGGYGQCWSAVCGCDRYVDALDASQARHPAGKAIPARLDERYDPSPEPIDRKTR